MISDPAQVKQIAEKSVLHQDFGDVLKKRINFSLFNFLVLCALLFVTAFVAGSASGGIFQLFSNAAMFSTGGEGMRVFVESTTTPVPTQGWEARPPGCKNEGDSDCKWCDCFIDYNDLSSGCKSWCNPDESPPKCDSPTDGNCDRACNVKPEAYPGCKEFCELNPQDCNPNCQQHPDTCSSTVPSVAPQTTAAKKSSTPNPTSSDCEPWDPVTDQGCGKTAPGTKAPNGKPYCNDYKWCCQQLAEGCSSAKCPEYPFEDIRAKCQNSSTGDYGTKKENDKCSGNGECASGYCNSQGWCEAVGGCGKEGNNVSDHGGLCCAGYQTSSGDGVCHEVKGGAGAGGSCQGDCATSAQNCRTLGGNPSGSGGCPAGVCCN